MYEDEYDDTAEGFVSFSVEHSVSSIGIEEDQINNSSHNNYNRNKKIKPKQNFNQQNRNIKSDHLNDTLAPNPNHSLDMMTDIEKHLRTSEAEDRSRIREKAASRLAQLQLELDQCSREELNKRNRIKAKIAACKTQLPREPITIETVDTMNNKRTNNRSSKQQAKWDRQAREKQRRHAAKYAGTAQATKEGGGYQPKGKSKVKGAEARKRAKNEKNKSSKANHSRKKGATKKASRGMIS